MPGGGSSLFRVNQTQSSESVWNPSVSSTPRVFNFEGGIALPEYTTGKIVTDPQGAGELRDLVSVMASSTTGINLTADAYPIRNVHSRLCAISPAEFNGEFLSTTSGLVKLDENAQYISLAVYLISNNMLEDKDCGKVIGYFEHQRGQQLLRSLLSIKASSAVNALAEKLLMAAAKVANAMIIKELVKAGADPNIHCGYSRKTLLHYIAERGDSELVRVLLEAGADVNAAPAGYSGRTALQAAAGQGHSELVRVLLEAGADVNASEDGHTALQAAAERGDSELVRVLLEAGTDVNAAPACYNGRTALQAAARQGHSELVLVLLEAGADVNAAPACYNGRTALQAAARQGHSELVLVLLEAGADDNAAPASDDG
jgi:ankyrin repeat protein